MPIATHKLNECCDKALTCHGTAYIFEKRAKPIRQKIRTIAFLGIAGPAFLGASAATYDLGSTWFQVLVALTGVIGIFQLVFSIWSLVAKWDDNLSYYIESKGDNYRLSGELSRLSKDTSITEADFDIQFSGLSAQINSRDSLDQRFDISEEEKRMGMKKGLFKYQRACAGCSQVPKSMVSTNCGVCGDF